MIVGTGTHQKLTYAIKIKKVKQAGKKKKRKGQKDAISMRLCQRNTKEEPVSLNGALQVNVSG